MLIVKHGFRSFTQYDLRATLENELAKIKSRIKSDLEKEKPEDSFKYISDLVTLNKIEPLLIQPENIKFSTSEHMISTEYFPSGFFLERGQKYKKEVITFYLPFTGDPILLRCVPSTRILSTEAIAEENGKIIFDVINFNNDPEQIKNERDRIIDYLKAMSGYVNSQIHQYNNNLSKEIEDALKQTAGDLSKHSEFLASIGTPLISEEEKKEAEPESQSTLKEINKQTKHFDVFICHASEDKSFVTRLANEIRNAGIEVWYDEFQIGWGDDLRPKIDNGLKNSTYGIVVFSKAFLGKKKWTEYELNGLFALEKAEKSVILPIWHEVTREDLAAYSPTFADRIAKESSSIEEIVEELKRKLNK